VGVIKEFLIFVFQPAICRADNVLFVCRFAFFDECLQFRKQISHMGPSLANTMGEGVVRIRHFGQQPVLEMTCEQVRCPGETAPVTQLFSSFLLQCCPNFSDQISVIDSCDDAAMFKIVNQCNSLSIPEYSCHNFARRCNNAKLSGSWRRDIFPGHTLHFMFKIEVVKPGLLARQQKSAAENLQPNYSPITSRAILQWQLVLESYTHL